jgi:hypothetical protein
VVSLGRCTVSKSCMDRASSIQISKDVQWHQRQAESQGTESPLKQCIIDLWDDSVPNTPTV